VRVVSSRRFSALQETRGTALPGEPDMFRVAETLPALTARHMVDLAIPAAVAASDRLSMTFSPRLVARHGNAAIRAFKLSF
jgi:hypothetical protein